MVPVNEPLTTSILAIMYFGDIVFAVSGALTAGKFRMDVVGFVLIGTITGIGGGTTIATERLTIACNGSDDAAAVYLADTMVVTISDVEIACLVHRHACRGV